MLDALPGDDVWAWLAGPVEGFNLLLSQESSGESRWGSLFF
jgi:hypothetical protein